MKNAIVKREPLFPSSLPKNKEMKVDMILWTVKSNSCTFDLMEQENEQLLLDGRSCLVVLPLFWLFSAEQTICRPYSRVVMHKHYSKRRPK